MTDAEQISQLEIEACLALKENKLDSAERIWQSMLIHAKIMRDNADDDKDPVIIKSLQTLLVFSIRNHKEFLFEKWINETWMIVCQTKFYDELGDFLNSIVFAAMDRKLVAVIPKLQVIFKQYLRLAMFYQHPLDKFTREWLSTAAEISARGISECSIFLVQAFLRILYFQKDWNFIFPLLREYYFHFQVACQHQGYEKAYQLFGLVHYLEIIFARRIAAMPKSNEQTACEKKFYRGICDFISNVAKVTGKSDKETLLKWKQLVTTNEKAKLQNRFAELYALELQYWQAIKPKSYQSLGLEN